ncbi:hypothetical protein HY469_04790 [Candidatus Roizmanbacteria bacterium]|nr:hypothetical protein [Candidatus Roizmanbacteria bacterium]
MEQNKKKGLKTEVGSRVTGYIVAAFGVVAGLAWNDAVNSLINFLFPLSRDTVYAKFIYAILITVILVMLTVYISRLFAKDESR